jgi:hypothetical protein
MGELIKDNGLGSKVATEGFKGPGLDPSNEGQDKEYVVSSPFFCSGRGGVGAEVWFGLAGNGYPREASGVNLV